MHVKEKVLLTNAQGPSTVGVHHKSPLNTILSHFLSPKSVYTRLFLF